MSQTANQTLRVGQLANKVGKTVRTIHFYEELGLLSPASRSKGGFRQYDEDSLTRIHWINRLQQLGFSLNDIREFLQDFQEIDSGPMAMGKLQRFYEDKLKETRAAIARHKALETELLDSLQYLSSCDTCGTQTPKTACGSCEELPHADTVAPVLVAALTERT
jgi:DNA-binding transcriptional MerR regulator